MTEIADAIVEAVESKPKRKKREAKKLSKSQRNQIRLLRGAEAVNVTFNGFPIKVARSSAIMLIENNAAKVKASLSQGEYLYVSLEALVKDSDSK